MSWMQTVDGHLFAVAVRETSRLPGPLAPHLPWCRARVHPERLGQQSVTSLARVPMLPRQVRHMTAQPGRLVRPLLTGTLLVVLGCGDEAPVEPPVPVATMVTVSPASSTTQALDDTVRLSATVLDQDGRVMATAVVEWSSGDTAVAVVDSAGLVTAVGSGAARVTAGSGGVAGEAVITVEQVVAEVRGGAGLGDVRGHWRHRPDGGRVGGRERAWGGGRRR